MTKKKLIKIVSLFLLSFVMSFVYAETKVVEVEKVRKANIAQSIRLLGTIKAKRSIDFTAKTNGIVEQIVPSGQKVKKGTLIAKLENNSLQKSMNVSLESVKLAKAHYERLTSLSQSNAVSKRSLEEAKNQWLTAQKDYLDVNMEYEKTHFIAPFDGSVGVHKVREGTQVQEGSKIVTLYDPSELGVEFDIPGKYLGEIRPGQKLLIAEKTYALTALQNMIDPETLMVPAYANISCEHCFIGETIHIDLFITEHQNVPIVSAECVFLKNHQKFVYLVKKNKAVLTPVVLGLKEKDRIEIVEGIQEGDIVITKGQSRLYPDIQVKYLMNAERT